MEDCRHRFCRLSFTFLVWTSSPTVAMSLLSSPSTACQSPSACVVATLSTWAYTFWRRWLAGQRCRYWNGGVPGQIRGTPFLRRLNLLRVPFPVVRILCWWIAVHVIPVELFA